MSDDLRLRLLLLWLAFGGCHLGPIDGEDSDFSCSSGPMCAPYDDDDDGGTDAVLACEELLCQAGCRSLGETALGACEWNGVELECACRTLPPETCKLEDCGAACTRRGYEHAACSPFGCRCSHRPPPPPVDADADVPESFDDVPGEVGDLDAVEDGEPAADSADVEADDDGFEHADVGLPDATFDIEEDDADPEAGLDDATETD